MEKWFLSNVMITSSSALQGVIRDYDVLRGCGLVWDMSKGAFDYTKHWMLMVMSKSTLVVVPIIKLMVILYFAFTAIVVVDRVSMAMLWVINKLFRRKSERLYKWEAIEEDLEVGINSANYPMVLVQIPMYNEEEVYELSIGAACRLSWPADRIIIQVLDDSTDPSIKEMVMVECRKWASKGINIKYETRRDRKGHKAGNLKQGMKQSYVSVCEFVAIFDADFQPDPDFLRRTVPFLASNPHIALVQARWDFVNSKECLLTRMQEMSLNYHFIVEQEVGSATWAYFGFNGSAGVWRISALNEAGGWKDRTTVEDMDLAVRATIEGWKFVYVGNIKVKSELPSTFKAYRNQQHRWSCGPAYLFKIMALEIGKNKKLSLTKKLYIIYRFFFVRNIVGQLVPFLYCLILPATILVPEAQIPQWGDTVYLSFGLILLYALATPRSLHLAIIWFLFENVMSLHRTKAIFMGLLGVGRVNEWVVTEKLGHTLKVEKLQDDKKNTDKLGDDVTVPLLPKAPCKKPYIRIGERIYFTELCVGMYLLISGCYYFYTTNWNYSCTAFLFLQSAAFFITGFGYVGIFLPNSKPDPLSTAL